MAVLSLPKEGEHRAAGGGVWQHQIGPRLGAQGRVAVAAVFGPTRGPIRRGRGDLPSLRRRANGRTRSPCVAGRPRPGYGGSSAQQAVTCFSSRVTQTRRPGRLDLPDRELAIRHQEIIRAWSCTACFSRLRRCALGLGSPGAARTSPNGSPNRCCTTPPIRARIPTGIAGNAFPAVVLEWVVGHACTRAGRTR